MTEKWRLIWYGNEEYPYPLSIETADGKEWVARDGTVSKRKHARRIIAAVNACSGIPTEALEADVVKRMRKLLVGSLEGFERMMGGEFGADHPGVSAISTKISAILAETEE